MGTSSRIRTLAAVAASTCFLRGSDAFTATSTTSSSSSSSSTRSIATAHSQLHMSGFPQTEEDIPFGRRTTNSNSNKKSKRSAELSAVAIGTEQEVASTAEDNAATADNFLEDWALPVISTSFLITANTVGASCLVLPELAAGPGFGATLGVSVVTYLVNLISGLAMAEVAIKQYESSGSEVASSFKDFADASFNNNSLVSNGIAGVSILTNAGILAFTFSKAGEIGSELMGGVVDPITASFAFVGLVGAMFTTLDSEKLSGVASVCVAGLFASFAGLLLPGLASVQDPMATLMAPGVADSCMGSAATAFPIIVLSLAYQNIVPSVTKILNYDRQKTTASLALGSFIPFAMYMSWLFASMGGGIDTSLGVAGPLLTGFTLATIAGSSIGTTMSVAEEFDSFFKASDDGDDEDEVTAPSDSEKSDVFSVPAVLASLAVPMVGTLLGGDDMTVMLGLAGSIGTPLLYGAVPALMAWNQRQELRCQNHLVPGGMASLGALGLASTGFVGEELARVVGDAAAMAVV